MIEEKDLSEQSLKELIEEFSASEERISINPTYRILQDYEESELRALRWQAMRAAIYEKLQAMPEDNENFCDDREAARRYPAAIIESVENNRND